MHVNKRHLQSQLKQLYSNQIDYKPKQRTHIVDGRTTKFEYFAII